MSDYVKEINDNQFDEEVINSDKPVLVDFWAVWCAPCKAIAPTIDEIAEEMGGNVKFCKVNVDDNNLTPSKYGIKGIPTLMLFKDGQVTDQLVGAAPKENIISMINKNL
ncbi:MAG: thioredoxin [Pseudomonadota bacterium]